MSIFRINFNKIFLPYFPDDRNLRRCRWHKAVKVAALVVAASCIYSVLWLLALFFLPFDISGFNSLLTIPAYLPLQFANFFTRFPAYGTLFQYSLLVPVLGPLTLTFILIVVFFFIPSLLYRLALAVSEKFYMRKVKIMLAFAMILLFWFSFSTWKFQQLINEGSVIADEQCLKVNPLIIERKNHYIDSVKVILASGSAEDYWDATDKYIDTSKKFMKAQESWLKIQKAYIGSRDFNTFTPSYMKEAARAQYDLREAELKVTGAVVELFETFRQGTLNPDREAALSNTIIKETGKSREADEKYNKIYDTSKDEFDLRKSFTSVPESKCPEENFNIPDVNDLFSPKSIPVSGYPIS